MKFLVFVLILWVAYLGLRSWVNRGGSRQRSSWRDSGHTSAPPDTYANPYAPRDSDDDCRPGSADSPDKSDNSGGSDCGGGDSGGGGSSSD